MTDTRIEANDILRHIQVLLMEFPDMADDEVLRADMIEAATSMHDFLRRLERARQETNVMANALDNNINELKARRHRFERREEAMRSLAMKILYAANLPHLVLPEATYSLRAVAPSVIVTNEDALPDAACRFKREPDKKIIKEMLSVGPVAGATMSNGGRTLSIRIK